MEEDYRKKYQENEKLFKSICYVVFAISLLTLCVNVIYGVVLDLEHRSFMEQQ